MQQIIDQLTTVTGAQIPTVIAAIGLLALGWIAALAVAGLVRNVMHKTTIDVKMAGFFFPGNSTKSGEIQQWTGNAFFYIIMLFVLMAVFQTLNLTQVNEPLNRFLTEVFQYLPRVMSAFLLGGIAWILATVFRTFIQKALTAMKFDERFQEQTEDSNLSKKNTFSRAIGETVYWLIFLLFLPAILGALALEGLLDPVKGMVDTLLGFLPNLIAAGVILGVGWFFARIVQRVVTNLLAGMGLDQLGNRVGLTQAMGNRSLSSVIGLIVYVLIFLPIVVAALQALELDALTNPASQMLGTMMGVLPDVFGAAIMIGIAYMAGKIVSGLVTNVLTGLGFNSLLVRLGLPQEATNGVVTPAHIAGTLIMVAVLLFAAIEAADILGLQVLAELLSNFTVFGGHLLFGLLIIGIGLYLANLAGIAIRSTQVNQAMLLATGARIAIIVLTMAMALRQMGLADDIVNLAFGLTLGALAIAFALALGLGGREIAATELRALVDSMKTKKPL